MAQSHRVLLIFLALLSSWEVVYSLNCSVAAVSILPENTTALKVTWTNLTEDFKSIQLTLQNVTKTDNRTSGEVIFDGLMKGMNDSISIHIKYNNNTCEEVQMGTTKPSPVSNLSVVNRTTETLTINWTEPVDKRASEYTYEITVTNETESFNKTYCTSQNIFQVTALEPGLRYNVTVKACTPENIQSDPETVRATTEPSPVSNLSVVNRTTETLTINWTEPVDKRASEYTYEITVTNETESFNETYCTSQNILQVTALEPGLRYNLTVKACTPENIQSDPETVRATTEPSPVSNLSVVNRTTETLTINWTEPVDKRASEYTYEITVTNETESFNETYCTSQNILQVTALEPGLRYNLTVKACTPENIQSDPETVRATTKPSPVSNLSVVNRTTETLTINWTEPVDIRVSEYTYEITVTNETESFNKTYCTSQNIFQVTALEPGLRYNVTVKACTPENIQSDPETVGATTKPSPVSNLSVVNRTTETLTINWTEPVDKRASEYTYEITVTNETESFNKTYCTSQNILQVTALEPGLRYNVTVKACTPENIQSDPETVRATTNPSSVTDLSVTNRTTETLTLLWAAPDDVRALNYTYRVSAESVNSSATSITSPGGTKFQVKSLVPGTYYDMKVESVTPEGTSSAPKRLSIATLPGPVSSLQCSEISGYSFLVEWSRPRGNCTGFNISLYDGGHLLTAQTIGKKYDFLVENLQPGRKYTFHIYTQTGQSYSARITQQCWTKSTPIIIGAVIGSLLGLILIGFLLFFIITKRVPWGKETDHDLSLMSATPKEFKPVHLSEYESYFQRKHADADFGFAEEYQSLSTVGIHQTLEAALLEDNKVKNRYTNVLPYDASRVKLVAQPANNASDYINASYMPGYRSDKEFIAAQGPLPNTLEDFWRMIWEQRTGVIVMLTNCMEGIRVKCERYWPLDYTPCAYGNITVTVSSETILSDWTIRDFSIRKAGSSELRSVSHFHFTAWPDHGVPKTTEKLIAFHKILRGHLNRSNQGFPIVHCSAGVGRTGTLIALDYLLQQMEQEGLVDVYGIVRKMRQNRPLMVQTELQYIFLHQCMLDTIQMKMEPEEAIYENQQDLIYENVSAIHAAESHVI
ncbi:receptor-type tyrosine-protein phosphatase H-like isoform X2 [Stegostoma tigrinum]|uniref:receptor-type tyrosine-protein phosphatase H-like isoform X2 n=1 Tax=Stegostoma tigrinum TaxID=3053191 RepID=UPI00286FB142|nr:receptor-type tyrosine-protein phosphatase H-like isoform X2 [Stegostoma tigrinum]